MAPTSGKPIATSNQKRPSSSVSTAWPRGAKASGRGSPNNAQRRATSRNCPSPVNTASPKVNGPKRSHSRPSQRPVPCPLARAHDPAAKCARPGLDAVLRLKSNARRRAARRPGKAEQIGDEAGQQSRTALDIGLALHNAFGGDGMHRAQRSGQIVPGACKHAPVERRARDRTVVANGVANRIGAKNSVVIGEFEFARGRSCASGRTAAVEFVAQDGGDRNKAPAHRFAEGAARRSCRSSLRHPSSPKTTPGTAGASLIRRESPTAAWRCLTASR
jgi:hypothetical protein